MWSILNKIKYFNVKWQIIRNRNQLIIIIKKKNYLTLC